MSYDLGEFMRTKLSDNFETISFGANFTRFVVLKMVSIKEQTGSLGTHLYHCHFASKTVKHYIKVQVPTV